MTVFEVPAAVQASIDRRARAAQPLNCAYGCPWPARLYPCGARCDDHAPWAERGLPEPGSGAYGEQLRAERGFKTDTPLAPTVLDERAEKSGKRVSAARRALARGQVGGEAT